MKALLGIGTAAMVALSVLAVVPTAQANNHTQCVVWVCATAAASVSFEKKNWPFPSTITYFCGWSGNTLSLLYGTADGSETGFPVVGCTGACSYAPQSGCGDQGSTFAFSDCAPASLSEIAGSSDGVFSTGSFAYSQMGCGNASLSGFCDAVHNSVKLEFFASAAAMHVQLAHPVDLPASTSSCLP